MSLSECRTLCASLLQAAGWLRGSTRRFLRTVQYNLVGFVLLLPFVSCPAAAADLPGAGFYAGWAPCSEARTYEAKNLYGYIDGGAELFLEFGFAELISQHYCHEESELVLDLYRMSSADAALAIYLAKKGAEQPIPVLYCRNTGSAWQIAALKGCHYIQLTNLTGEEKLLPVMVALVQQLLVSIPEESPRDWWAGMPADRIPGSELLVAGPWSLQMIYTLGEGDLLQLGGRVMGAAVDRPGEEGKRKSYLRISYPDTSAARAAFANVTANLDPYLHPVHSVRDSLVFKDYQEAFGRITRSDSTITLELFLSHP